METAIRTVHAFACKGTVKHDKKIDVWVFLAAKGVGQPRRVLGLLEKNQMLTILQESMLNTVWKLFPTAAPEDNYILQQDYDPKNACNLVQMWLNNLRIPLLPRPSQSSDLNSIENLWEILDRRLQKRSPQNEEELFVIIKSGRKKYGF